MKSTSFLLSFVLLIILTACGEKSASQNKAEIKNIIDVNISQADKKEPEPIPQTFILTDISESDLNITLYKDQIISKDINKPLVLLNLFASWSPPCKGTLSNISRLQKKYQKDLLVVGVLVNDDLNRTGVQDFMKKYDTKFYISYAKDNTSLATYITKILKLPENFPIPLSILYKDKEIFRYYIGAMPIEIMDNELKQALKLP